MPDVDDYLLGTQSLSCAGALGGGIEVGRTTERVGQLNERLVAPPQDLSGFDDTRSEKSEGESDISGMSSSRKGPGAARRDATLAELRELKANIESQARGTVVSESAEVITLKAEVESLRTELVEAHIKEAQASS